MMYVQERMTRNRECLAPRSFPLTVSGVSSDSGRAETAATSGAGLEETGTVAVSGAGLEEAECAVPAALPLPRLPLFLPIVPALAASRLWRMPRHRLPCWSAGDRSACSGWVGAGCCAATPRNNVLRLAQYRGLRVRGGGRGEKGKEGGNDNPPLHPLPFFFPLNMQMLLARLMRLGWTWLVAGLQMQQLLYNH